MTTGLGEHYIIELYDCENDILNDMSRIKNVLLETAEKAGATIVGERFHQFSPQGVSGVVVVAESHLSIHTWPEHKYAALDFFTCGTGVNMNTAFMLLKEAFAPGDMDVRRMTRGLLERKAREDLQLIQTPV